MLWQTQLDDEDTLYVDIFVNNKFDFRKLTAKVELEFSQCKLFDRQTKDDTISKIIREKANALYKRKTDVDVVILTYNEAILLAIADSENLGMCYANRASCFMRLKKYSLCLRDIQLARKNGYPQHLFAKLDDRRRNCLRLMQDGGREPLRVEAKLSFPSDEKNPGVASVIALKQFSNGDKRTLTKRNLEIGQTVIVEEAYELISEYPSEYRRCTNCFKADANLIPCSTCSAALFCSQKCYDAGHERFHNIECGINYQFQKLEIIRRCVLRTIVVAIQTFGTIEALMDAVQLFNKEKKIDESDVAKKNYFQFFGSRRDNENLSHDQKMTFRAFALTMLTVLTRESILEHMFISTKSIRFMGHLILHHFYVVNRNAFRTSTFAQHTYKAELGVLHSRHATVYAMGIAFHGMHMRHSCVPNVARILVDNKIIYKTIRPIKSGEELFISYMHPMDSLKPTESRTRTMSANFPLKCECISCLSKFPPFQKCINAYMDGSLIPLLNLFEGLPQKFVKRVLRVDRTKLDKYEKSIVDYLQRTDNQHPTEVALKLQYLLTQIWANLHAVYLQA